MCLIIVQPQGHTIPRARLTEIFTRNNDGFGIMRAVGGVLHTWRTVGDVNEMLALYYANAAGRACVLHWRMATHGNVDVSNAHPFTLTRNVAFVHNGVLDIGTPTRGMSDTWHMATHVLAPIARDNENALFTGDMQHVLEGIIGTSNKLVFAHADGRVAIVNRAAGVEHQGCWYSNTYAWDAPAHLRTARTARSYTSYLHDVDWGTPATVHGPAHVPTQHTTLNSDVPPGLTCDGEDAEELLRQCVRMELVELVERNGEAGALEWVRDYPNAAAELLCDHYTITQEDAAYHVHSDAAAVASWVCELTPLLTD